MADYSDDDSAFEEATMCFACWPDNPIGLRIDFTMDGDRCSGEFTPTENHVGYENALHGGIVFACLDDVMANVLYRQKRKAHTAKCEVRYRKPLEVGQTIGLAGWIESERRRLIVMQGEARLKSDDSRVASCDARFMLARARPMGQGAVCLSSRLADGETVPE